MMNEEEEEIFMRPIQKQEVVKLLKQYNLLNEKNLKPLECLTDTEFLDMDLAALYWNLLVNKNSGSGGGSSSKKSEISLNKIEESFIDIADYGLDVLESSETLGNIQWAEIMEPKNDDRFEEFENNLMQLDDAWESASLKIFEEYAKIVLNDGENEDSKEEITGGINYVLVENKDQQNKMKKVLDLDKRIKELMEELGDERKKKKVSEDRTSLNANSVLNDTIEEMEVLMKCGESYMTRKSIVTHNSTFIRSKSDDSIFEKTSPVPKMAERSCRTPQPKKKNAKAKARPKPKSTPSTSSCSSKFFSNDSEFKIPKTRPPARRAIYSPIGDYIKHSSTTPLIKKVVSTPITGPAKLIENYREVLQETSNNTAIKLPTKTYKPAARSVYVEKENEAKVPKNIQKLYSTPIPQVIKHLGRVPSNSKQLSRSNFENNEDLTVLEETKLSEENLDDTQKTEISLRETKQALHSNTLQTNCK